MNLLDTLVLRHNYRLVEDKNAADIAAAAAAEEYAKGTETALTNVRECLNALTQIDGFEPFTVSIGGICIEFKKFHKQYAPIDGVCAYEVPAAAYGYADRTEVSATLADKKDIREFFLKDNVIEIVAEKLEQQKWFKGSRPSPIG